MIIMSEKKSVEQQTPQEQAGITLNDIANVVRIIDVASQRGAFRGPELSQVGTVHDRLMKFLEANQPKPAEDGKPKATDDESKGDEVDKLD
tara:strand:- start:35 stop:307 length:273 start_codon:yes stop_codon:yes gene_type:complete